MTDDNWKTLRVPPEAYEQAKAQKEAADRTWGEQVVRPDGDADASDAPDVDALVDRIAAEIDTAAFNGGISDATADRILGRLDDLENTIPRQTAEELQR